MYVPSGEKCYVLVESSKEFDSSLLSNISISLISKYLRQVEHVPLAGISTDSCQYQVSVTKKDDGFAKDFYQLDDMPLRPEALSKYEGIHRVWFGFSKQVTITIGLISGK